MQEELHCGIQAPLTSLLCMRGRASLWTWGWHPLAPVFLVKPMAVPNYGSYSNSLGNTDLCSLILHSSCSPQMFKSDDIFWFLMVNDVTRASFSCIRWVVVLPSFPILCPMQTEDKLLSSPPPHLAALACRPFFLCRCDLVCCWCLPALCGGVTAENSSSPLSGWGCALKWHL